MISKISHVVIVGAGFGGLEAARNLRYSQIQVTVIDRSNHHLFQPLLYQVATAGLAPSDIAAPIRGILRNQKNTEVMMAEVCGIDTETKHVKLRGADDVAFDFLIVATGARHGYFGHEDWEKFAPGLKSISDATKIRRNILLAFEGAEMETDPTKRQALLSFVIVGGGPTGVEIAGAIAELAQKALASDFRHIDPGSAKIILVEAGPRILAGFPPELSERAVRGLNKLSVEVKVGTRVERVDAGGVYFKGSERILSRTVIWAAGVVASPAGSWLGAEMDSAGRVKVLPDLSVPYTSQVFVIGDTAHVVNNGKVLPGISPVAMQEGRYVARLIRGRVKSGDLSWSPGPFCYRNKGNLATIGRSFAIADFGKIRLSGFIGWVTWLAVHIYFLIGFRNRILVLVEWAWAYLTFQRGSRLIVSSGESESHE